MGVCVAKPASAMGAPQQMHSHCGRRVGAGGLIGCLNTRSRSSAIRRLLLGLDGATGRVMKSYQINSYSRPQYLRWKHFS